MAINREDIYKALDKTMNIIEKHFDANVDDVIRDMEFKFIGSCIIASGILVSDVLNDTIATQTNVINDCFVGLGKELSDSLYSIAATLEDIKSEIENTIHTTEVSK